MENEGEGGNAGFQRERDHSFGVRLKKGRDSIRRERNILFLILVFLFPCDRRIVYALFCTCKRYQDNGTSSPDSIVYDRHTVR